MTEPVLDLDAIVARVIPQDAAAVLAVSGGLDSMVLLDLVASMHAAGGAWTGDVVVATFDHASGPHSRNAVAFVVGRALDYGLPVVTACAARGPGTEAAWRDARWRFLRSVAAEVKGVVLTGHTRDDQLETVLMRALRGAGARGLAGLYADADVRRPFVDVTRGELHAYASARQLAWVEDPTNASRRFLRNRVRLDHLPALRRACPAIGDELLAISQRASQWRRELAELVDAGIAHRVGADAKGRATLDVAVESLDGYSRTALGVVWPELAARAGATLDRRGTRRAAEFTTSGKVGHRVQLSGGWELFRGREYLELRALDAVASPNEADGVGAARLEARTMWDRWSFGVTDEADVAERQTPWIAPLPADRPLSVRRWQAGDRMAIRQGGRLVSRKVKRLLSDAGISGHIRGHWPVVLAGEEILWVPGVRRSDAATVRPGGPVVTYVCDYLDRRP